MALSKEIIYKLLPVAIMAHNEEKVIQKAVESVLSQNTPSGFTIKVVVVANGCSDRTEEIVKGLEEQNADRVVLISMKEKGKTRAINRAIDYFHELSRKDLLIPYVIFFDADCEFLGEEVLVDFINSFEENPKLCAVGADYLPDVFFNSRKDIVAEIYRATYTLGQSVKINSISGMCYAIRFEILKKIDFPNIQFNEDMFVCSRLEGWFYRDRNIKVVFRTPSDLQSEINRRTRQEISTQRYHQYYSYLKNKGIRVRLLEESLGDEYRWWGAMDGNIVKKWAKMKGLKPKVLSGIYILIRLWAKTKASIAIKRIAKNENLDFWQVLR